MRCPFCASPRASLPECWACGMSLEGVDPTRVQYTLDDLEPTRYEPVAVQAERIRDLQTWKDSAVDEVLTDSSVADNIPCPNCGRGLGLASACPFCGAARVLVREIADSESFACCGHCGTPNPFARALCLSCGTRLEA